MKDIIIVVISTHYMDARKVCENIEAEIFETFNDLRNVLKSELNINENDENRPQFFTLTDFMLDCNDEEIDINGSFISYVKINDKN